MSFSMKRASSPYLLSLIFGCLGPASNVSQSRPDSLCLSCEVIVKGAEANLFAFRDKTVFEGIQICFRTKNTSNFANVKIIKNTIYWYQTTRDVKDNK